MALKESNNLVNQINLPLISHCRPLLAYSNHGFGSHSSYPIISKYISCHRISTVRKEPNTFGKRAVNRLVRAFATSQWYKLTSLELEWQLVQSIDKLRPNLIHLLWAERDLGYINLINRFSAIPLCCTFHCCPEDLAKILPYRQRLRSLAAIIIMSETQRPFFEACGIAPDKIHCIPHGIDTEFFFPSPNPLPSDDFTVLSVGSYKRNFSLLREVAVKLRTHPEIKLKILSSSNFRQYFYDLNNVQFISGLTDLELLANYQSASCLLLTVENATANNALLEGLACGLPVVTEKIGGIPEYINSDCAVVTETGNADRLVDAIVSLSTSPHRRDQMAIAARTKALELSWPRIAAQTVALYQSLVKF